MREWEIVFDLAGRDEDALVEQVERILCGPGHREDTGKCAIEWFACSPHDPSNPFDRGSS